MTLWSLLFQFNLIPFIQRQITTMPQGALYCKLDPIYYNPYSVILFAVVSCWVFFISVADVKGLFITEMIQKWSISVTVIINCWFRHFWELLGLRSLSLVLLVHSNSPICHNSNHTHSLLDKIQLFNEILEDVTFAFSFLVKERCLRYCMEIKGENWIWSTE